MADNVAVTAGSGTTIAADEVVDGTLGTVKVQYVKIMDGTLDGATKAAVGASGLAVNATHASGSIASGAVASGAVASGAFASGSIASGAMVDVGAIADAAVTAGATGSLSAKLRSISRDLIANIVLAAGSAIIGKVGVDQTTPGTTNAVSVAQLGSTTIATGSGVMSAGTQRVAIASDSPGVITTGTAGTPSAVVLTVQGVTSMTKLLVTPDSVALPANQSVNNAQVNAVTILTGTGAVGTGAQRIAVGTDTATIAGSAPGTAGSASANVITVQGVAGATPQPVGGVTVVQAASSTITRPADTTAYTSGDLVANSVTAGSVTNLQFTTLARVSGGSGVIIGAQIQKSTNVATSAAFRLHLFNTAPTYTSAGDNSAIATVVVASAKGYLGYIDITAMVGFSDVCWGSGAPDNTRGGIPYVATAQIIFGLLEARGAYTPGNAEVFTVSVDALQD
jgi:hypothetical protein